MTSLVLSIIDYCNILLSGLPEYKIRPLERIIRSAVRVVYNIPHCEKTNDISITQLMKKLKWLSVNDRIKYKICISIHSAIHHNSPSYLSDCVDIVQQSRALRECHTWRIRLASPSDISPVQLARSFGDAGYVMWNSLPSSLRAIEETRKFKIYLKLFF